jgi:hypothetical protein
MLDTGIAGKGKGRGETQRVCFDRIYRILLRNIKSNHLVYPVDPV